MQKHPFSYSSAASVLPNMTPLFYLRELVQACSKAIYRVPERKCRKSKQHIYYQVLLTVPQDPLLSSSLTFYYK